MSANGRLNRLINYKCLCESILILFLVTLGVPANAGPAITEMPSPIMERDGDEPTMDELRAHAATIIDILETASERVDRLAAADAEAPALVDAIRQELSLSRRWNRHLGTILLDVAEARRALGERERKAAKEITRMTAVAEAARLELVALKSVLKGRSDNTVQHHPDQRSQRPAGGSLADAVGSSGSARPHVVADAGDFEGDLLTTRTTLASLQEAQISAVRDVDAVRAKIIEALETLAAVNGFLPVQPESAGGSLSSEDITAWAASMAARLNRNAGTEPE